MSHGDVMDNLFHDLLADLFESGLDDARWQNLQSILREHPDARDEYIRYVCLHAQLQSELEWQGAVDVDPPVVPYRRRWFTRASVGAAFAASAILAIIAWLYAAPESPPRPSHDRPIASSAVATVIELEEAVFDASGLTMSPGAGLRPGLIQLEGGRTQIMFNSTAMVDLHGPCTFEMTGPNRGRLTSGRLEADVPEAATGFTVDLPDGARLVDLGTRFSVDARAGGGAWINVAEGVVELHTTETSASPYRLADGDVAHLVGGRLDDFGIGRRIAHTLTLPTTLEPGQLVEIPLAEKHRLSNPHPAQRLIITCRVRRVNGSNDEDQWFGLGVGYDAADAPQKNAGGHLFRSSEVAVLARTAGAEARPHGLFLSGHEASPKTMPLGVRQVELFTARLEIDRPAPNHSAAPGHAAVSIDYDADGTIDATAEGDFDTTIGPLNLHLAARGGVEYRVEDLQITAYPADETIRPKPTDEPDRPNTFQPLTGED